jgi:hypothetical protein
MDAVQQCVGWPEVVKYLISVVFVLGLVGTFAFIMWSIIRSAN